MEKITSYLIAPTVHEKGVVKAWEEIVSLPTYETGKEEKNPIFLEKRVYQGSTGSVYPYPVIEKISDEKKDKKWKALFIENEYIKVMILPELGGRIQMAYDKVAGRHFVYYNQVIKPALVGLTGPWISGGIEFNWPQHHRPSTYLPTEYMIEEHEDGSKTVWCSEIERMFRTKGMHGFTLYPSKAYIEIKVKIYNRTSIPQTFLWWSNPAVAVNDHYHSVFPPDVHSVFDHGKRDVSNFPIATGVYYKHDYSEGVDISKYKNIPVPTSYMAVNSKYDFVGGYEQDTQAGLLHVADHQISPGKKQWTWGCGDFGKAWDRNLTDEDGPYIELMTGVYTDNQPDFSWLQPCEEKSWVQYFLPYTRAGYVKNASKDIVLNISVENGKASIVIYTTSVFKGLRVRVSASGNVIYDRQADVCPENPLCDEFSPGKWSAEDITTEIRSREGDLLLEYCGREEPTAVCSPAIAAKLPSEINSIEQLLLTGKHLEQYRHATYEPADYYLEALRREPGDIRCNIAYGQILFRSGLFAGAEEYFRRAVATMTQRNPNPYDGEPHYMLGLSLLYQMKFDQAYDAFYKSTWNAAWQDPAFYYLATIESRRGNYTKALEFTNLSLGRNVSNHKSRHLRTALLRRCGMASRADDLIDESLSLDGFNLGCRYERYLIRRDEKSLAELEAVNANFPGSVLEYALDYHWAGFYSEACDCMELLVEPSKRDALFYFTWAYFAHLDGRPEDEQRCLSQATEARGCFPNRIEDVNILLHAIDKAPKDYIAPYLLGNFFYSRKRHQEATRYWEMSVGINNCFPTSLRNLSLAYYNKSGKHKEALGLLKKAFELDKTDSRIFMELDQLLKRTGTGVGDRLRNMKTNIALVEQRDDLYVEYVTLHNLSGFYEKALELMRRRKFHPWEGGEGKITRQWEISLTALARISLNNGDASKAYELLLLTEKYPDNLGEGRLATSGQNDLDYYKGLACRMMGEETQAVAYFKSAAEGPHEPVQAFYYNDTQPDKIYFQGLSLRALGEEKKARSRFNKLIDHGRYHYGDECRIDYFAVSLPDLAIWEDDLNMRNRIHCNYVMAMGNLGLGNDQKAMQYLTAVVNEDNCHPALYFLTEMRTNRKTPESLKAKIERKLVNY